MATYLSVWNPKVQPEDRVSAGSQRGVHTDVVIMSREGRDELVAAGRIAPGTVVDLAPGALLHARGTSLREAWKEQLWQRDA